MNSPSKVVRINDKDLYIMDTRSAVNLKMKSECSKMQNRIRNNDADHTIHLTGKAERNFIQKFHSI